MSLGVIIFGGMGICLAIAYLVVLIYETGRDSDA